MNWKRIQQAWQAGDKEIAVRLLESMVHEMRLRQRTLGDFQGVDNPRKAEVETCQNGA